MFDLELIQLIDKLAAVAVEQRAFDIGVDKVEDRNLTASGLGASGTFAYLLEGGGLTYYVGLSPHSVEQLGAHALVRKVDFRLELFGESNVNRVVLGQWD
jgi:hypothetical protein